jgi:hypothetical protein
MSFNIKNTEAHREKLDREKHGRRDKPLSVELLEIGKRCAAHMRKPVTSSDHAALLYDHKGLPTDLRSALKQ